MKILFMGHKGCGKSTEIQNISKQLEDDYCIVNFSIANEIELQGIDYVDVIFIIMEQLLSFVGDNPNLEMDSAILDKMYDYWTQKRIKEIVHLEETGVLGRLRNITTIWN